MAFYPTDPIIRPWQRHLMEAMAAKGHAVQARRSRTTGSTMWRIDAGRWTLAGPATRKMEIAIYGRPNP